jgi:hypothetical protein
MTNYVIPTVGMTGYYRLIAPFDGLINLNTEYTCQDVRSITACLANNEDVLKTIYLANGLVEADYVADRAENMLIISLQSQVGQWVYVPVRYVASYPLTNGVLYHNVMMGVGLGAIPVRMDLATIESQISDLIYNLLGIRPAMKAVQVSKATFVSTEQHEMIETTRQSRVIQTMSNSARADLMESKYQSAIEKIKTLEAFIVSKGLVQ